MGLQSVIDHFLAKLQPYNAAYDDEESTDSGPKRRSDTHLLLAADQMGEQRENRRDDEDLTGEGEGNTVQLQEQVVEVEFKEEKDHSKPLPSVGPIELQCLLLLHAPLSFQVETVPSKRPKYFFIANEILTSERTLVGYMFLDWYFNNAIMCNVVLCRAFDCSKRYATIYHLHLIIN